jgi:gliotoxin biosynthesis cytochrome P450 monooxygenase
MLEEVKNLPDDLLSFRKAVYKQMLGRYTSIGAHHPHVIEAIKLDLTQNLSKMLSGLQDEVTFAVDTEFGVCDGWTAVKVSGKLVKAVARISARVFVGLPLCRDEEWVKTTIKFTEDIAKARKSISKYPFFLRPFITPFLPECRQLKVDRQRAGKMLAPAIAAIIKSQSAGSNYSHGEEQSMSLGSNGPYNLVSWILGHYNTNEKLSAELIGEEQLLVSFAAIHTTSLTATQAVFDLASYPEYIPELRAELNQVASEEPDGKFRKSSMPKLRKLDSFIKESQRMHPLGMGTSFSFLYLPCLQPLP